jgi:hypothetical protein
MSVAGHRYRTREVLTLSGENGEKCPHLSETQACEPEPCYLWNVTVGDCMMLNANQGQTCGIGNAYRTVACVNKFGVSNQVTKPPNK